MRALMISNPNSTSQSHGIFREIVPVLRAVAGMHLLVKFTHYSGHAEDIVRGLTVDDYDVIIAVGGDGTVNEIVNGLLGPAGGDAPSRHEVPALAVIPTGSANVFVRALGFPSTPVEATHVLARSLEHDLRRTIYLGTWNERWFAVNAGFGMDADVLARVDRAREQGFSATPLRYLNVAIRAWLRARRNPPQITVCAESRCKHMLHKQDIPLLFTSNTDPWTFLGPLPVVTNPHNSFDEGLALFGLEKLSGMRGVIGLLHLFGADKQGLLKRLVKEKTLGFDDAQRVELECRTPQRFQADGEFEGIFRHVTLTSVADAIEVYAPQEGRQVLQRSVQEVLRDFIRLR
ncbi:diacylglycerol kinase family lipid kinase [Corynebacterium macginleyi]|nr:diacylglycerol kinase family lipid kinase [Corynebacterium macginleyi]MBK4159106.1 diacylglycerol kinase family lipid kinase [Corynebacterium macginleyi]MBK4178753.1 diacylglycerol kinase family lipid kinase [Corynebacterium macginleyi]